jgi:hypothetical protein
MAVLRCGKVGTITLIEPFLSGDIQYCSLKTNKKCLYVTKNEGITEYEIRIVLGIV